MKVIQLNCVYNFGSTGKIVKVLHEGLLQLGIDSYVYYGRGVKSKDYHVSRLSGEVIVKIQSLFSKIIGNVYGGSCITTRRFIHAIKTLKPDVVHLQCINANTVNVYKVLDYLQRNGIPTVLTLHAEFLYTGGCSHAFDCEGFKSGCFCCKMPKSKMGTFFIRRTHYHWEKMKSLVEKSSRLTIVGVSEWVKMRAESSPIFLNKKVHVIHNGVDTDVFYRRSQEEMEIIEEKYVLPKDKKIILHVTPNFKDPNKGKDSLIKLAELSLNNNKDFCIVVVGYNDESTILPKNIIPISFILDPNELASLYSLSMTTLLLSKRETYSMVCAESLCCGTPVIGYKAGAPELIALENYSSFFEYGDVTAVFDAICNQIENFFNPKVIESTAKEKYSRNNMIYFYKNLYEQV